jgi:hypothetical protein
MTTDQRVAGADDPITVHGPNAMEATLRYYAESDHRVLRLNVFMGFPARHGVQALIILPQNRRQIRRWLRSKLPRGHRGRTARRLMRELDRNYPGVLAQATRRGGTLPSSEARTGLSDQDVGELSTRP